MNRKHHKDFEIFSRALIGSKDADPTYPFIKNICKHYEFEIEWFIFVYVAFYSIESAIRICKKMPTSANWNKYEFENLRSRVNKFGHERRGNGRRPDVQIKHLEEAIEFISKVQLQKIGWNEGEESVSNSDFRKELETMSNVGGWAAFKIAELFEKSAGYEELEIKDLGLDGRNPNSNDGPVGGLRWIYGRDNIYSKDWFKHWNNFAENLAKAWKTDIGIVETCVCKWHKFNSGKYYVGHDIDEFQELVELIGEEDFKSIIEQSEIDDSIFSTKGVVKSWKKVYKEEKQILNSKYGDSIGQIDVTEILLNTE